MTLRARFSETAAPLALAVALAIPATACHRGREAGKTAVPVRVEAAQQAGASAGVRYSANVQPREQMSLAFKSPGYVREILRLRGSDGRPRNVQQGDTVTRGTVLARVRETDYLERVNHTKAQLAEVAAAFERQRLDFERAKQLYESKSLSRADFDAARSAFDSAQARVAGAQAQLDTDRIGLEDCALTAPMDALVLARNVETGTLVASGTVGFVLADTTSVKAVFGVPDTIVRRVKPGQPIALTVEAIPGAKFSGKVTAIAASAEKQTRVFDVEVTIPNADGRLRSGMIATVETPNDAGPAASAVAIPLTAIVKAPGDPSGFAVMVVSEDGGRSVAKLRNVKLGEVVGNRIAVTSGLAAGERVIVMGATLVSGRRIRPDHSVAMAHGKRRRDRPHNAQHRALLHREPPGRLGAARRHRAVGRLRLRARCRSARTRDIPVRVAVAICPWPGASAREESSSSSRARSRRRSPRTRRSRRSSRPRARSVAVVYVTLAEEREGRRARSSTTSS